MTIHRALSTTLAVGVALAVGASSAAAAMKTAVAPAAEVSPCDALDAAQVLLPFGDTNLYTLVADGSFEAGGQGWAIDGTGSIIDDPAYAQGSAPDSVSLELGPGSRAISPPICANTSTPTLRFFQRAMADNPAVYSVDVSYLSGAGTVTFGAEVARPTAEWALTPHIYLKTNKIKTDTSGWGYIRLHITAPTNSPLRIDGVYLDPKMR